MVCFMGCIFRYSINFDITIMEELEQKLREAIQEADNEKAKKMARDSVSKYLGRNTTLYTDWDLKSLLLAFDDNGSEIIALWDKVGK